MRIMPQKIKNKIKQLQKAATKTKSIERELYSMLELYKIDPDVLLGNSNPDEVYTEALSFVVYGEGEVEENIKEIEKVFLYYVNKDKM